MKRWTSDSGLTADFSDAKFIFHSWKINDGDALLVLLFMGVSCIHLLCCLPMCLAKSVLKETVLKY